MSNQIETIIEYQLDNRDKKTVFWRGILAFPMVCFIAAFTEMSQWGWASGFLILPVLLALVFRGIYPSYLLSFNHSLIELHTRVTSYVLLLTDDYPSIERNPKVAVLLPDVRRKEVGSFLADLQGDLRDSTGNCRSDICLCRSRGLFCCMDSNLVNRSISTMGARHCSRNNPVLEPPIRLCSSACH